MQWIHLQYNFSPWSRILWIFMILIFLKIWMFEFSKLGFQQKLMFWRKSWTGFSTLLKWVFGQITKKKSELQYYISWSSTVGLRSLVERGKFKKSSSKIYGAHAMVFQAQISNFIEFGPEMAQRNSLKVYGLFCTFPWF